MCHQLGIAEIHCFHCLCHRHVNKSVWKQAKEVTKKRSHLRMNISCVGGGGSRLTRNVLGGCFTLGNYFPLFPNNALVILTVTLPFSSWSCCMLLSCAVWSGV